MIYVCDCYLVIIALLTILALCGVFCLCFIFLLKFQYSGNVLYCPLNWLSFFWVLSENEPSTSTEPPYL